MSKRLCPGIKDKPNSAQETLLNSLQVKILLRNLFKPSQLQRALLRIIFKCKKKSNQNIFRRRITIQLKQNNKSNCKYNKRPKITKIAQSQTRLTLWLQLRSHLFNLPCIKKKLTSMMQSKQYLLMSLTTAKWSKVLPIHRALLLRSAASK